MDCLFELYYKPMLQASSFPSQVFDVCSCSWSQFYLRGRCVLAVVLKSNFSAQPQLGYAELRQVQAKTIEKVKVFWPSALKNSIGCSKLSENVRKTLKIIIGVC